MGEIQMQTAQIFPPKDLVYFLTRWQTPLKEQPFFPPKTLVFSDTISGSFQNRLYSPAKDYFATNRSFMTHFYFETIQAFTIFFNIFAFSPDYESSIF